MNDVNEEQELAYFTAEVLTHNEREVPVQASELNNCWKNNLPTQEHLVHCLQDDIVKHLERHPTANQRLLMRGTDRFVRRTAE